MHAHGPTPTPTRADPTCGKIECRIGHVAVVPDVALRSKAQGLGSRVQLKVTFEVESMRRHLNTTVVMLLILGRVEADGL